MGTFLITLLIIIAALFIFFLFSPSKSPEEVEKFYKEANSEKILNCPVVGLEYHSGKVKPGEFVEFNHDEHNQYDKNAVEVKTLRGKIVGYIPKKTNKKLLRTEGEVFGKVEAVYKNHTQVYIEVRRLLKNS